MALTREAGISRSIVASVAHELGALGASEPPPAGEPTAVVSGGLADAMFERAAAELGDPALGLTVAGRLAIGALGDLDYALCTSVSLRLGMQRLARFYSVATERVRLSLEESGDEATLVFEGTGATSTGRHWRELGVAVVARRIRQTVGRSVPFSVVAFAHAPPPDLHPYEAFFGTAVRFGERVDRLAFERSVLDEPLRTASAALGDLLEANMRALAVDDADAWLVRVRRTLAAQLDDGDLSLATTAARLATSSRSLQRALAAAGLSHKTVLDDVRRERALALLERGLPVVEIADRLAFSHPRAFFRAFRRWTGTSPATQRHKPH